MEKLSETVLQKEVRPKSLEQTKKVEKPAEKVENVRESKVVIRKPVSKKSKTSHTVNTVSEFNFIPIEKGRVRNSSFVRGRRNWRTECVKCNPQSALLTRLAYRKELDGSIPLQLNVYTALLNERKQGTIELLSY